MVAVRSVYISADIEGVTGLVSMDEAVSGKPDYPYFRKIMTEEVNAVARSAFDCGVQRILVRDAHGNARNILLDSLDPRIELIRGWSGSPLCMMDGIDQSFDAVFFVGYHASSGTANAVLKHTYTSRIYDLRINGQSMPEAGWNALIAGYYGVPVVLTSGDSSLCEQVTSLIEGVVTVPVKKGMGTACLTLNPVEARKRLELKTREALNSLERIKPYTLPAPYTIEIQVCDESIAWRAHWYPGAKCDDSRTVVYHADDFFDIIRFFFFVVVF